MNTYPIGRAQLPTNLGLVQLIDGIMSLHPVIDYIAAK
jgi:hypothetical protein